MHLNLVMQHGKEVKRNIKWRREAAEEKLKTIYLQSRKLKAKYTIPFASFIYFSNQKKCISK